MNAHRIWIERRGQLEDEIWADSPRCEDTIVELLGPLSPDTAVSYGTVPGGAETRSDTWCGACGGFMWHGADCDCPDKAADREPLENPPFAAQCPECGEAAIRQPPADLVPWGAHGLDRPEWSHADRSALCPVIGPDRPACGRRRSPWERSTRPRRTEGGPDDCDPAARHAPRPTTGRRHTRYDLPRPRFAAQWQTHQDAAARNGWAS